MFFDEIHRGRGRVSRLDWQYRVRQRPNMSQTTAMIDATNPDAVEFLRMPSVIRRTGLARSTIYRLIAERKFPVPVRLADRAVAWRRVDLEQWSASRSASSV